MLWGSWRNFGELWMIYPYSSHDLLVYLYVQIFAVVFSRFSIFYWPYQHSSYMRSFELIVQCFTLQCNVIRILQEDSWLGRLKSFLTTLCNAFVYMLQYSYVSSAGTLILMMSSYSFVPSKLSRKRRALIGVLHVLAHMVASFILMLLLELGIEICIRNNLLATSGAEIFFPFLCE